MLQACTYLVKYKAAVLIKNESYSLLKFQFCQVSRQNY